MKALLLGVHPVIACVDVTVSIQFYTRLGFNPVFQDKPDEPRYAVIRRDAVELHLQWAGSDQWAYPIDRPVYRLIVDDVDELYGEFVRSGSISEQTVHSSPWGAPADTPWGTREFHLRDAGQNGLQFYRPR
jgi:hypothetical protein